MVYQQGSVESMVNFNPSDSFWSGKKVLVTGHTGFKGGWLVTWLNKLGAEILGVSLKPTDKKNLFEKAKINKICDSNICDINNYDHLSSLIEAFQPEIVFHLAAQPLVLKSYQNPIETFQTNVIGAANLLQAIKATKSLKCVIMITTDKVYLNREWIYPYRERDTLGGHDPYSASKACNELLVDCYRKSYFDEIGVGLASVRAGNVIGGGDWSQNRLIPDAIKSWQEGRSVEIRRPNAIRPWQHVLEPLCGYMLLAQKLWSNTKLAGAYNFGPLNENFKSVFSILKIAKSAFGKGDIVFSNIDQGPHEAGALTLDTSKSISLLGYRPRWSINKVVKQTISWYQNDFVGKNCGKLCLDDICEYEETK